MLEIDISKSFISAEEEFKLEAGLKINRNNIVSIFGPSGSGKTTLLRVIAGLIKPDSGGIISGGIEWNNTDNKIHLPPQKRNIGMVYQSTSLFPHWTVKKNLEYADPKKGTSIVDDVIDQFELNHILEKNVQPLSGGQKQRVELARALVRKPNYLLLDEPFSGLDFDSKRKLSQALIARKEVDGLTIVFVTHDIGEVIRLSDYVYIIDQGKITKEGFALDLFASERGMTNYTLTGEIIKITKDDILNIVFILIGNSVVKIVARDPEIEGIKIGDMVSISSKAFNPVLSKLNHR